MATRDLTAQDFRVPEPVTPLRRWRAEHWLAVVIVAMVAALALSFAWPMLSQATGSATETPAPQAGSTVNGVGPIDTISVDDKAQIVVEGAGAQAGNAAIPFLSLPLDKVQAFGIAAAKNETYLNALKCLTQAVYYEAATEPLEGRRAVAQVVLNRTLHPAYPKSVCGVVYQGAERHTGCQFSFTCDGALLRVPSAGSWREAQAVAIAALAGHVEPSVGTATFYHADYVLPKWAFTLGKITQLGHHIFYRFHGNMGRPLAFNARYNGVERVPMINYAALADKVGTELALAGVPILTEGLTVAPEVTDRHAPSDVGGRLDVTKSWRLSIPDPVAASSRYRQALGETAGAAAGSTASGKSGLAAAESLQTMVSQ